MLEYGVPGADISGGAQKKYHCPNYYRSMVGVWRRASQHMFTSARRTQHGRLGLRQRWPLQSLSGPCMSSLPLQHSP